MPFRMNYLNLAVNIQIEIVVRTLFWASIVITCRTVYKEFHLFILGIIQKCKEPKDPVRSYPIQRVTKRYPHAFPKGLYDFVSRMLSHCCGILFCYALE